MKFTSFWAIAIIINFANWKIRIFPRKDICAERTSTCLSLIPALNSWFVTKVEFEDFVVISMIFISFFKIFLNRKILDLPVTHCVLGVYICFDCFFCFQLQNKELQCVMLPAEHLCWSPGNSALFLPCHTTVSSWQLVTILLFEVWGFLTVRNAGLAASF